MLVNSVVIVLREILEAALLVSVLLALSRRLHIERRWLMAALPLGITGAVLYALMLVPISELFDGAGQELLNAAMRAGVFIALVVVVFLVVRLRKRSQGRCTPLVVAMTTAVALAIAQEGAEIFIYVSGFFQVRELVSSVGLGSFAGAAVGLSAGALFYYLLLALPEQPAMRVSVGLLGLAAASMSIQATVLLIQVDYISASQPLWDSSAIIDESSLPGQLLYALVGYESTPSLPEVGAYIGSLAIVIVAAVLGWRLSASDPQEAA